MFPMTNYGKDPLPLSQRQAQNLGFEPYLTVLLTNTGVKSQDWTIRILCNLLVYNLKMPR